MTATRLLPSLTGRFGRRVWAQLVLLCLLGNLALPGLAQAWVASSAEQGEVLVAVCTSSGVRMVSVDPAGDTSGPVAGHADSGGALPGQSGSGIGHCQACLGHGPDGLMPTWATMPAPVLTGRSGLFRTAADIPSGAPVWPGAPTRAPPASAD